MLAALDEVAAAHGAPVAAVALAWLAAQPTGHRADRQRAPAEQLDDLLAIAGLELSADELARLTAASAR